MPNPDHPDEPFWIDQNGDLTERRWIGGLEVIVHHADIPPDDMTVVQGVPCTTALRTVIDIAVDHEPARLAVIVQDCLDRRLFTVDEARARLARADMANHPGAELLRRALPS